jgi:hypothetical protein
VRLTSAIVQEAAIWQPKIHHLPKSLTPSGRMSMLPRLWKLDREKLAERVAASETAIFNRLQAISQSSDHHAERQAIEDALTALRVLKRESLGFPDWGRK